MARNKHTAEERYFYHPDPSVGVFDEIESGHLVRVLRMQNGDEFTLSDGKGNLFSAVIVDAHVKRCKFTWNLIQDNSIIQQPTLHLAVALTKNADRIEWALEKCVEIGISHFTPLITERTERKQINYKRLQQIAISAIKQSRQVWLPQIDEPISINDFLNEKHENLIIAYCGDSGKEIMLDKVVTGANSTVLIGPEGDFTPEEVQRAIAEKALVIRFDTPRLRTETAAIYTCSVLNSNKIT